MEYEDLDVHLKSWRKAAQENLPDVSKLQWHERRPATLHIGAMAEALEGDETVRTALAPLVETIAKVLRRHMTDNVWPLSLKFKIDDQDNLIVDEIGTSNMFFSDMRHRRNGIVESDWVNYRSTSLIGLTQIASDMRLLQKMTPPSNQPVQAWSIANDLMGTPHVHFEGIHARSKSEALLKMIWSNGGRQELEDILSAGKIGEKRNDDRQWFVASELQDLHLHPVGRAPRKLEAVDEIASHLENLQSEAAPEDDEFSP